MTFFSGSALLSREELGRISARIAEVERGTSGEIRVSIHRRRPWKERKLSFYEYALKEFHTLGMNKTKQKTGVLLFMSVKERAFQIIADEGIHKRVGQEYWNTLASTLASHFKEKKFCDGICAMVDEIGVVLKKDFPSEAGDRNELSNDVVIS